MIIMDPMYNIYSPLYFIAGYKKDVGHFDFIGIKVDLSTLTLKDYFAGFVDPFCKSGVYNHIFNNDVYFVKKLTWGDTRFCETDCSSGITFLYKKERNDNNV